MFEMNMVVGSYVVIVDKRSKQNYEMKTSGSVNKENKVKYEDTSEEITHLHQKGEGILISGIFVV